MKKYYTLILAFLLAQGAMATDYNHLRTSSKLSAISKAELIRQTTADSTLRVLIRMTPGSDASTLASDGIKLTNVVNHFAIATVQASQLDTLVNRKDVERISFGKRKKHLLLDKAHASTGVDKIHLGTGLTQPYTGKGVAIGILDQGFDPNHVMFQDAEGKSRFKLIGYAASDGAELTYLTTPSEIASYTTDYKGESHATHVSGIAAGNYQGTDYQIQGVAPEADLLMGPIPTLPSDLDIFDKMIEWCKENGNKRLVVNMSYGMNAGCHDETDTEAALMDEIIKKYDIVACISAGNEADYDIVQRHTFTGEKDEQMTAAFSLDSDGDGMDDVDEIYDYFTVSDKQQVEISLAMISRDGTVVKTWPIINSSYPKGRKYTFNGRDTNNSSKNYKFSGYFTAEGEDIGNGMKGYYLDISNIKCTEYKLGYVVKATAGQTVTSYLESTTTFDTTVKGCANDMTHDGTINSIACGTEPIVVGAYNTADSYETSSGYTYDTSTYYGATYGNKVDEISFFSSYGKLVDGRELPTACTPGLFIVSSFSRYGSNESYDITHNQTVGTTSYPFGSMSGTSMSSPYMSGICALWLEADSTLTHTQIRDIAQQTAINDTYCTSDNYYTKLGDGNQAGAGKVDAYAGLKYILDQKTSILSPIAEGKDFMIRTLDGCTFEAYTAGATSMTASLYTLDGRKVASNSKPGNTIILSAQGQSKGIYALRISDGKHTHAQKVVVK